MVFFLSLCLSLWNKGNCGQFQKFNATQQKDGKTTQMFGTHYFYAMENAFCKLRPMTRRYAYIQNIPSVVSVCDTKNTQKKGTYIYTKCYSCCLPLNSNLDHYIKWFLFYLFASCNSPFFSSFNSTFPGNEIFESRNYGLK